MDTETENLVLKMTVNQLKGALRERGVKHLRDMRKAELQKLLLNALKEENELSTIEEEPETVNMEVEREEPETPEPEPMELEKPKLKRQKGYYFELTKEQREAVSQVRKELLKIHGEKAFAISNEEILKALESV